MSLNEDNLDELRTRMLEYMDDYGLPTDRYVLEWFQEVAREDTTPEQAFAPLYEDYFSGSGGMFTIENWLDWTTSLSNIVLRPNRAGGINYTFDFDFDSDSGDDSPGSGSRQAHGYF